MGTRAKQGTRAAAGFLRITLVTLLWYVVFSTPVSAHTRLERSSPAAGDTLRRAPYELRLVFSQAVAPRYTTLVLRGPDGAILPTPALLPDAERRVYVAMAPPLPAPGRYTIEWRTTSADGHVISGTIAFLYAPPGASVDTASAVLPAEDPDALHEHHVDQSLLPPPLRPASWQNALARFLQFAAVIALLGLAAFRGFVLPHDERAPLHAALKRFGGAALTLLVLTLPARLWLQSAALHGPDLALERGLLGSLLLELPWGRAWLAQLAAAALIALAIIIDIVPLIAIGALALAFAPAFQGHAAAVEPFTTLAMLADGLHVVAAGTWIGTLAVILLAAIPSIWKSPGDAAAQRIHRLIHRFSPLALTAAAVLALSGVASALMHIHAPAELVTSVYGRTLIAKLLLVAGVIGAGWYNWKRARPQLGHEAGVAALRRAAAIELGLATAALAVTAALVALPTP